MKITIISQTRKIYEGEATEITVPTTSGTIGILKDHANLVSVLDVGIVKIENNKDIKKLVINRGVIEVVNDNIKILANEAELAEDVMKQEIDEAIKNAEQKISSKLLPTELIQLEKQLRYQKLKKEVAI